MQESHQSDLRGSGIEVNIIGGWRHKLRQEQVQTVPGHGRPREEELVEIRRELRGLQRSVFFGEK